IALDSKNPIPHEPCIKAPMKPRERTGQVSIARAAPAGHSAPMPMPSSARNRNRTKKLGASPAMKLQIEYQPIEIISGVLRPIRSASQPLAVAPRSRIHNVIVSTKATFGHRHVEFLGDRRNDQQKRSEVERVEGPPGPGCHIGIPLVLSGLPPPWNIVYGLDSHHPSPLPVQVGSIDAALAGIHRSRENIAANSRLGD